MSKVQHRTTALLVAIALAAIATLASLASAPSARAIVGGQNVGAYPWAAALLQKNDGSPQAVRFKCSGALIKSEWVLTAAHCLDSIGTGDTVVIGRDALSDGGGAVRSITEIKDMRESSTYCDVATEQKSRYCDIALVKLNSAVSNQDLDLAGASVLAEWGEGTSARAYGYGSTCATCASTLDLRRTNGTVQSFRANHYTLFAQDPNGAVCYGDSGGPLIVSTSEGAKLVGVVRARTDNDDTSCTIGDSQSFVKVGWRGSAANSQPYQWITASI